MTGRSSFKKSFSARGWPPSRFRCISDPLFEMHTEFGARNFTRAKRKQMRRRHLAIYHAEIARFKKARKMHQAYLRSIRNAAEHGFAKKNLSQRKTVQPANQFAITPRFHAVRIAQLMHHAVSALHFVRDPGA